MTFLHHYSLLCSWQTSIPACPPADPDAASGQTSDHRLSRAPPPSSEEGIWPQSGKATPPILSPCLEAEVGLQLRSWKLPEIQSFEVLAVAGQESLGALPKLFFNRELGKCRKEDFVLNTLPPHEPVVGCCLERNRFSSREQLPPA